MKTLITAVLICAGPAFAVKDVVPTPGICGPERDAGTAMPDGTVVGEKQTLDYLKEKEPGLYAQFAALPPQTRRARFAAQMMWFQNAGNCRTRQKAEALSQLQAELGADELADAYVKATDVVVKASIEKRLRAQLEGRFDSEMRGMDIELGNIEAAAQEYQKEAVLIRKKILSRKKNRDAIVDKHLRELLRKR